MNFWSDKSRDDKKKKFSFLFYICVISFDEIELGFRGFGVGRCEIFAFWSGNMGAIIM